MQVCNTEVLHEELKGSNMSTITVSLNAWEQKKDISTGKSRQEGTTKFSAKINKAIKSIKR